MRKFCNELVRKFRHEEAGTTLVEYGVALIVALIVGGSAMALLADNTTVNINTACGSLVTTVASYSCP